MGRCKGCSFLGIVFIFVFAISFSCAEVETGLKIENSPPYLKQDIPIISFDSGSYSFAFDLDDYFSDYEQSILSYTYAGNDEISVSIDSQNRVSFFAPSGFNGSERMAFFARDNLYETESNTVVVYVGDDLLNPYYSNVSINKNLVYQNDFVKFRSLWYDDRALSRYELFLYQGEWQNFTGEMSGRFFSLEVEKQITAPVGEEILWKICGYDTFGNSNCTEESKFFVYEKTNITNPTTPVPVENDDEKNETDKESDGNESKESIIEEILDEIKKNEDNFSINTENFLIDLKQGTSQTRVFEIKNTGDTDLNFDLSILGLDEMVVLSESSFILESGKSKLITIDFKAGISVSPGEYYGELTIRSIREIKVPMVLYINSANLKYDLDVSVEKKNIKPGRNVTAKVKVESLEDIILSDLNFYYAIKDFQGNVYTSNEFILTLEKESTLDLSIKVPEDLMTNTYLFYVKVDNEKDYAVDSDFFYVGVNYRFDYFLKYSFVVFTIVIFSFVTFLLSVKYKAKMKRERALSLYVKFQELKEYMKDGKYEKAADLYYAIKKIYGERVDESVLKNKEELISKIEELSKSMNFEDEPEPEVKEDGSSSEEKKEDASQKKEGEDLNPVANNESEKKEEVEKEGGENENKV